jgi:hypothetical protein
MARNYLSHVDLNKNQLQNAVIHPLGTAPSAPTAGQVYFNNTGGSENMYYYDGSNWQSFAGDVRGIATTTSNQISLSNENGPTPTIGVITGAVTNGGTALATGGQIYDFVTGQNYITGNETITLSGDATGSGTTSISVTIAANAVEGSMLNDNVISGLSDLPSGIGSADELMISDNGVIKRTDISVLESYMQSNLSFPDNDVNVANLTARLPQITESVTIGDATDVTVTIAGNLVVNGTTTTVNSNTVSIGDNILVLNSDEAGTPSQNAGIEIERGTSDNVSIRWNEGNDNWELTNDGSTYTTITAGGLFSAGTITNEDYARFDSNGDLTGRSFTEVKADLSLNNVENTAISTFAGSSNITTLGTISTGTWNGGIITEAYLQNQSGTNTGDEVNASESVRGVVELATNAETLAGTDIDRAVTPAGIAARSFAGAIGDGSNTSYTVTHNLNSRDVVVQLYDASSYETVFADVTRTTVDTLTVAFTAAPTTNDIKVLVAKID